MPEKKEKNTNKIPEGKLNLSNQTDVDIGDFSFFENINITHESGVTDPMEDKDLVSDAIEETPELNSWNLDKELQKGNRPPLAVDGFRMSLNGGDAIKLPQAPDKTDKGTFNAFEGAQITERAFDFYSPFSEIEKKVYGTTPMTIHNQPLREFGKVVLDKSLGFVETILSAPEPQDLISEAEKELGIQLNDKEREEIQNTLELRKGFWAEKSESVKKVLDEVREKDLESGVMFRVGGFAIGIPEPAMGARKKFVSVSKKTLGELVDLVDDTKVYNKIRSILPDEEIATRVSKEISQNKSQFQINEAIQKGFFEIEQKYGSIFTQTGAPDSSFGTLLGRVGRPGNKEQTTFSKNLMKDILNNDLDGANFKLTNRLKSSGIENSEEVARRLVDEIYLGSKSNLPNKHIYKNLSGEIAELERNTVGGKTVAREFKTAKLNITKEQEKNITDRLEVLGLSRRKVKTFGEMESAAQELGVNPTKLLQDVSNNRITSDEVVALRNNIKTQSERIKELTKKLKSGDIVVEAQQESLRNELNSAESLLDNSIRKLARANTEAGRAIVANRIHARNNLDPVFWYNRAVKELNGRKFTTEMQQAIDNLIDKKDIYGLANFVSLLRRPSNTEKAITLWKAGLLTAPTTFLANLGGNTTMRLMEDIKDVPAWLFDVAVSPITGKRTKAFAPVGKAIAEGEGFKIGAKDAWDYVVHGANEAELLKKYDIPRNVNYDNVILNIYTKSIFKGLGSGDLLFKAPALRRSLFEQSYLQAKKEGLKGQFFKDRVRELMLNPDDEMSSIAINAAEFSTFMGDNILSTAIQAGERAAVGKTKGPVGEFIVRAAGALAAPFRKTPTNIADAILEYSPAGFVKAIVRATMGAGQRETVETLGRATTGTGLIYAGYKLAEAGLMTGNAPSSQSEKADYYARGEQPHSLLVNNKWRRLDRVSPLGNLLALGADIYDLSAEKKGAELVGSSVFAGVKGMAEQTFLKGASGMLKATIENERNAKAYLNQTTGSLVPNIIGRTARLIDPSLKKPEGVGFEALLEKIPVLRGRVATRRGIFGNPAVSGKPGLGQLFDPFTSSPVNNDPVLVEAKRIGFSIGMSSQTVDGIKMTESEYDFYQEKQGKILHGVLNEVIDSSDYLSAPDYEKKRILSRARRQVRSTITDTLFPAIMIQRYGLPKKTNPQLLRSLLSEASDRDSFNRMSEKEQAAKLKELLKKTI